MSELPAALRAYLWAIYLSCALMVSAPLVQMALPGHRQSGPPDFLLLANAGLFTLLSFLGERTTLQLSGSVSQSLATVVHVALLLLFPAPMPMYSAFVAILGAQWMQTSAPLYKRAFNVCHSTLIVGGCGLLFSHIATPPHLLRGGHVLSAIPALILLIALYYALDIGLLLPILTMLQRRPPWIVWLHTYRRTLFTELGACTIGVLAASSWLFDHILLALFILPVVALRAAFRTITAEDRAIALRRRSEHLEAVLAAGQRLQLQQTRADLLVPVVEAAHAIAGARTVAAYLRDTDRPALLGRVVLFPAETPDASPTHIPAPSAGAGIHADPAAERTLLAPLAADGTSTTGLLRLRDVPLDLSQDARDALAILATQAGIALQNAQLHERALAQASADGLTGLLNHRALQMCLEEEVHRAMRDNRPLALIMVDLDDFSVINNRYGHQTGDAALVAVAAILRDTLRAADVPARYGGDEFAVLLPGTSFADAYTIAERLRGAIADFRLTEGGVPIRIGASLGVAALPTHATTRDALIRAADQAVYAGKHAGKGRVGRPEDVALSLARDPDALTMQLEHANMATVEALAAAVDAKDQYTKGHSQRVATYAVALARALDLDERDVARVRLAGLLHDVGKVGVPDAILTKADALSPEEFATIQQHPVLGERMLGAVPFLSEILPVVRHHHERHDGRGYPDGLAGSAIPRDAAIVAVADAYDAMTSTRTYRPAIPPAEACRRMRAGNGTQFDPRIIAAFERALADGTFAVPPDEHHGAGNSLGDPRRVA